MKIIEEIYASCDAYSTYSVTYFQFRNTITPAWFLLNRELSINLMYPNKTPVLHIIHTATNFQNTTFLKPKSADDIGQDFLERYTTLYNVLNEIIILNQE